MRARKGEVRNQRHGEQRKVIRYFNGREVCSIASGGIDAPPGTGDSCNHARTIVLLAFCLLVMLSVNYRSRYALKFIYGHLIQQKFSRNTTPGGRGVPSRTTPSTAFGRVRLLRHRLSHLSHFSNWKVCIYQCMVYNS
jgi:hypothetical protein